jgi:DNA-binding transcriptional MerR regulator
MRIGKFAENNELSIDTIRHYMDFGLILPAKQGGQYFFDTSCQRDLEEILKLKDMGFTLSEIKDIFMFRKLGKLTPYQEDEYYRTFFINKLRNVEKGIEELKEAKERLEEKLQEFSQSRDNGSFTMGVDLRVLNLLQCISCGGNLILSNGSINNNQIIDGTLKCACGREYAIDNGILKVDDEYRERHLDFDYGYIREYINVTDADYLDNLYKGMEWSYKKMDFNVLNNKVLLELGSGIGFFLRYIYNNLPEDCIYIAVDHDMSRHRFLKDMLEKADCKRNIIFICADFLKIPVKDKSVDMLLDISGTSNYSFTHEKFLLGEIDSYIKNDAYLLGSYIMFKNFTPDSMVKEEYRKNFNLKNVKQEIGSLSYKLIDERTSDYLDEGGKYESYFKKGEKVYSYIFYGKR